MKDEIGTLKEWVVPFLVCVCFGWMIWHMPNYLLDFIPPESQSLHDQMTALADTKDVTPNLFGLFGGQTDILDWLAMIGVPVFFYFGIKGVKIAPMELQDFPKRDYFSIFIGRITMMLILGMTCIMLYEVFLRYAVEKPTLWANELTLWIGGFVFLLAGLYGMQQRSHIRIFLLYDAVPRWCQRIFDTIWVSLVVIFAAFMIFGSYKQVFYIKFYKWEMFGTAFDPPIPATIQPTVLIVITLVAVQAVSNLIADWNKEPEVHTDEPDEEEIEAIRKAVGGDT